ncbi:unnamed protein product [Clonostachys byssicola]|uniref:Unsaturated glucuronyl hydrolase n=1 Tax=Clonostachys byssicola TaxID=160290 RepID=A0A9N9UD25_9HYPO|nr:unnamed protein product [Clonostachys byssicola]
MRSSSPVEHSLPHNGSPDAEEIISAQSSWSVRLSELYSDNLIAKVLRTAAVYLENNEIPSQYPEIVPQTGVNQGKWETREIDFWTSGFFPGCIYSALETCIGHPGKSGLHHGAIDPQLIIRELAESGRRWSDPLKGQALRTDTHDLGFVTLPSMRPRWELFHDQDALKTIIQAANSLASRFDDRVSAVRSWDTFDWHDNVKITCQEENFLVIIDSMANMELLFYAAAQSGDVRLANIAVAHSRTLMSSHLRKETCARKGYQGELYSTPHLVNFDPGTGLVKEVRTAQGYSDSSTWSRGQAWGVLGYAQAYQWSGHGEFLDAACGLAEYFLFKLETAPDCVDKTVTNGSAEPRKSGRYVPLWDFDAPIEDLENPLRDVSAGLIAANGMVILAQCFSALGDHQRNARYLDAALIIVEDILNFALAREKAHVVHTDVEPFKINISGVGERFDAILKHSTVCYNASSFRKNKAHDHGLVYADYYLLTLKNRLLQMGII